MNTPTHLEKLELENARIEDLRARFKIPITFRAFAMPNGNVDFDHCDVTITITPNGVATETWMTTSDPDTGPAFITRAWNPGDT